MTDPGDGLSVRIMGLAMFALAGELDTTTRPILDAAIGEAVAAGGSVLLDVSGLTFIDSTGIHALAQTAQGMASGCIVLHGVQGPVRMVMEITRLGDTPRLHMIPCTELAGTTSRGRRRG